MPRDGGNGCFTYDDLLDPAGAAIYIQPTFVTPRTYPPLSTVRSSREDTLQGHYLCTRERLIHEPAN